MLGWLKSKKWLVLNALLVGVLVFSMGIQVIDRSSIVDRSVKIGIGNEKVITLGHITYAAGSVDYTYDGTDDDVQFTAALNALPATGGRLVDVSAVQKNFAATVTRAIANVTITGTGYGSYFANDGVTALFTAGGNGWTFENLRTDAGGINMGATTGWAWFRVNNGSGVVYDVRTPAGSMVNGAVTASSLTDSGLTSGRIPIAGVGGLLGDDADLTWTGGNTLRVDGAIGLNKAPDTAFRALDVTKTYTIPDDLTTDIRLNRIESKYAVTFGAYSGYVRGTQITMTVTSDNTQNWTHGDKDMSACSILAATQAGATGTSNRILNLVLDSSISGMTFQQWTGLYVYNPVVNAPASVVTCKGIEVAPITSGSASNYALYTNAGWVYFGDNVYMGSDLKFSANTSTIDSTAGSDNYTIGQAIQNGVGYFEIFRMQNAVVPYFSMGAAQQFKFYTTGYAEFGGYVDLYKTDTDGAIEGRLWYDDSENALKYFDGTDVQTLAVVP